MKAALGRAREKYCSAWIAAFLALASFVCPAVGQAAPDKQAASDKQSVADKQAAADRQTVNDEDEAPASTLPTTSTPEERNREAWSILTDATADAKHAPTRIQAMAALGDLRSARSEKLIVDAMADPDVDVRTAAALAAGQTKDRNLTTPLRNLLDDKEPQVDFTAAMTLWKMNDRSGEDVLMAVVDGERSPNPSVMHGTKHKINKDLHNPAMLAKLGAMQGAAMLLGPFGFGITAIQFMHQGGGNYARASAIAQISQEKTEPIHNELLAALGDKDSVVRVAALKGLMSYRDTTTSTSVYKLLADSKYSVRLTAAAAYLRTTGTPGPVGPPAPVRIASGKPRQ